MKARVWYTDRIRTRRVARSDNALVHTDHGAGVAQPGIEPVPMNSGQSPNFRPSTIGERTD